MATKRAPREVLYNGIVLPRVWPPQLKKPPADPVTPHYLVAPPAVIPIDVGRQLFVDDFLIERTTLKRTFHLAEYYAGNPVLHPGMPYSDGVWFDPLDRTFKMWYAHQGVSYATSRNGIHWDKPALDVKPGTNVVLAASRDSAIVWIDLNEPDPRRRYKMFRSIVAYDRCRCWINFSPDGIHWSESTLALGEWGDRSTVFYNPFRKLWIISARHGWEGPRARRYWEMTDLIKSKEWHAEYNPAPYWIGADSHDLPRPGFGEKPQLYNLDCVAYESLMLGLFTIWRGQPQGRHKFNDVCLGFSRDGWSWSRPDRRAFCGISEDPAAWNHGNVQSAGGGCLVMGDKLYFYVSGRSATGTSTGLAFLRRDGFASMDAGPRGGLLTTRPVRFEGKHLFVNVDAPEGELRAEVLDESGRPIAPFMRKKCEPVQADTTRQRVVWAGADDLSALIGRKVRFRFSLANCKLYSFWISPERSGASYGWVAAGGPEFRSFVDTTGDGSR